MECEFIKLMVQSIKENVSRSRGMLIALLILSGLYVVSSYNLYFSWLRTVVDSNDLAKTEVVRESQQQLIEDWVDTTFINLPLLGIKIHATDTSMIGSMAISFMYLALFFLVRKLNHTIGQSYRIVATEGNLQDMRYLYYGITMASIFNPTSRNDKPIDTIEFSGQPVEADSVRGVRFVTWASYYLPSAAIVFGLAVDVMSIWMKSPFRDSHDTVWAVIIATPKYGIRITSMLIFATGLSVFTIMLANRCIEYQKANHTLTKEFGLLLSKKQEKG